MSNNEPNALSLNSALKLRKPFDDVKIPVLGLGTFLSKGKDVKKAVKFALNFGYRHIDTAYFYNNEKEIGKALKESVKELGVSRDEIFLTTKIWNSDLGYDSVLKAADRSLKLLDQKYVDLLLIHWPVSGKRLDSWKAFEKLYKEGKARAIGVSNFTIRHLNEIIEKSDLIPAVNQIEITPFYFDKELIEFCKKPEKNIALEAYSPLSRARKFDHPLLKELSDKYSKTPAQIMIRWGLQHGFIEIPKSTHEERIKENASVFDFQISDSDMTRLDSIEEKYRVTIWDRNDNEMFK